MKIFEKLQIFFSFNILLSDLAAEMKMGQDRIIHAFLGRDGIRMENRNCEMAKKNFIWFLLIFFFDAVFIGRFYKISHLNDFVNGEFHSILKLRNLKLEEQLNFLHYWKLFLECP